MMNTIYGSKFWLHRAVIGNINIQLQMAININLGIVDFIKGQIYNSKKKLYLFHIDISGYSNQQA